MTCSHCQPAPRAPRILLVVGSLRGSAFNGRLAEACRALMPSHWHVTASLSLGELPLYNQDHDGSSPPEAVVRWRQQLQAADGVVVLTPEYNHSMPGVLKNAIDWASSPPSAMPLSGKVIAAVVATAGSVLGRAGLDEVRRVLLDMGNFVVPTPQVVVYRAAEKIRVSTDAAGHEQATLVCPLSRALLLALFAGTDQALSAGAGPLGRAGLVALAQQSASSAP